MKLRILTFVIAVMAVASSARADGAFFTPYLGFNFGGDSANCLGVTSCEEHRLNFGAHSARVMAFWGSRRTSATRRTSSARRAKATAC